MGFNDKKKSLVLEKIKNLNIVRSVDLYKLMCVQGVQSREACPTENPYLQATNPTNLYKYIESTIIYLTIQTTNLRFLCKPFLKPILYS